MKPDDWVEKCVHCEKPTVVSNFAIIFSKNGNRMVFDKIDCFIRRMTEDGYFVMEES